MPTNSISSPSDTIWWPGEDIPIAETYSPRPSSISGYSVLSDSVITLPVTTHGDEEMPQKIPPISGGSTPEVRHKLENASPETARYVALRMYQSLKRHGLKDEVGKAFTRDGAEIEEVREGHAGNDISKKSEELMGMQYLMRDGFVSYLRDVARITPPIPQQVVRFSGIKYSAKIDVSSNEYETFGNKVVGCFLGPFKTLLKESNSTWLPILKGVDGYIMPGSITLLLGPPGCGKSSLLEIIAGRVQESKNSKLQGSVMYNDKYAPEIRLSRLIAYISGELNKHIPFLSVRETLEFARDCTQGLRPENFTPQMRKFFAHALVEGQDPFLEYILEILSLKNVEHKLTGEAISDVDRQKLTTAELALGTYSVMLYDQPFSGFDLAATYDLVDTLRTISRIQQSSALMALTQLSQEVFDLFDRIILLGEGHILFQGPRQDAINYFANLGYRKPSHVESAEFLEDIVAGYGSQYMAAEATPLAINELAECYKTSDHHRDVMRTVGEDHVKHKYWVESEPGLGLSLKMTSKCSVDTEPRRETELVVAKLSKKVGHSGGIESTGRVQAGDVITAISMNNEEMQYLAVGPQKIQHDRASHAFSMLKKAQDHICIQVERYREEEEEYQSQWEQFQRPFIQTWWKSTKTLIYRQIKITKRLHALMKLRLFQALGYSLGAYFLAGLSLAGNGAVFLQYLFLLFLVAYFGSSIFFFLSAISSIVEVGNALAGLLVSIFLLFSGFVIYPSNIPSYWKWLIYVNPIHWANVSFCRFQFNSYTEPCSNYLDQLPFCDQFPKKTVGKAYLSFYELYDDAKRPWLPYAILLGWTLVANLLALMSMKKIEFRGTNQSLPQLKKTPVVSNFTEDAESEFQSVSSHKEHTDDKSASRYTWPEKPVPAHGNLKDNGGVEKWIEEFRVDLERTGLGIPVEPMILLFEDLSFTRFNEGMKESVSVFKHITGYARPQNMLALVGGCKTSKSTLLKCLAGRIPPSDSLSGNLHANGVKPGATFFRLVGYVEKLDAHQPYLSVRESLQFSAALRLSQAIDPTSRRIHVELVLNQLGLMLYSNHLVGSLRDATGKTFEIAKKMTIAVELAANPSILFLEEPICGLDTAGTLKILNILTQLSESGRAIIATLTHPNARSLSFFNQALILTREGQQAYYGSIGPHCNDLLNYFAAIPESPRYFLNESPVSFVMGALGLDIRTRSPLPLNFVDIYNASSLHEFHNKEINNIKKLSKNIIAKRTSSAYPAPYPRQASLVLLRTQRFLWRNVQYTYGRLTGCIMIGLLMGSLYFQIEYKDVYGLTSRSLYIYMQVILVGVISANNVIPQIGTDRLVYFREKRAGMYLPIFYPVSWAVAEIPYFLIATLAVVGVGNGMAGIGTDSAAKFLMYWLVLFMFALCVTYFGMMVTFLAPVPTLAAFMVSIVTSLWVSASGVVVVISDIRFYKWMYWSNPFQFAINAMTSISFYCDTTECRADCRCPRLPDGSFVWDRLASARTLSYARIDTDILTLSAMSVVFAGLAFLFFVVLKHNRSPRA
ncbi:hypothetical protein RJ640_008816 [Escallonia rubra]|uniref:ABC transporter domain-containing protein n=1 Tax=Escallonia rubra TaxID=112253 RepID=A0AA88UCQ3_9ASTE|nr:hypothetical protein RJ640_008816 [Escallonia rubra]